MGTIGTYQGQSITGGSDASVAAQVAAINASSSSGTRGAVNNYTPPAQGGSSSPSLVIKGAPSGFELPAGSSLSGNYNYSSLPESFKNPQITPTSLAPATPIPLPPKTQTPDYNGLVLGGNIGLGIGTGSKDKNGNPIVVNPSIGSEGTVLSPTETILKQNEDLFRQYINDQSPVPSLANEYANLEKSYGIAEKQQAVNDYTAQINAITAQSQADQLRTTGQGRGIPEVIIGGQQAQIAKEAAIKVLPIQAQLAAAQGNLEFAQSRLDTFFKLRTQDIQNEYNYKKDVRDATYSFLNDQQKTRLASLQKEDDRKYAEKQANLQRLDEWSKLAVTTGQSNLISKFASLDPSSSTFNTELTKLSSQVRKPTEAKSRQTQVVKLDNGSTVLLDTQTGAIIKTLGGDVTTSTAAQVAPLQDKLNLISELKNSSGFSDAVGPNSLARVGVLNKFTGAKQEFIGGVQQLVSQDTLNSLLTLKKAGGTLGALSEGEGKMLKSSATKIGTWEVKDKDGNVVGYNVSEKAFKKELDNIKMLTDRAIKAADPYGGTLKLDDRAQVQSIFGGNNATTVFNPATYYSK